MSESFSEDRLHELLDTETALMELAEHPSWQVLRQFVHGSVEEQRRRLLGGYMEDHDSYLKVAWQLRGVELVLDAPAAISQIVKEYRKLSQDA